MILEGQSMESWFANLEHDWSGENVGVWTKKTWWVDDLRFLEYKKSLQAFGEVLQTHLFTLP